MDSKDLSDAMDQSLAIVMGGGAGSRLFPLTKDRAKPAVPLAGKYRLVDIPISNCINSGLSDIYVLTQFNSTSLHRHINNAYKFDIFSSSFIEILAAQQTPSGSNWYQGTADAVRQNLKNFTNRHYDHFFILSGDQLYTLDFRLVMLEQERSQADITIATIPVTREEAKGFGIMHVDETGKIVRFVEKPKTPELLDELRMPVSAKKRYGIPEGEERFLASMGIYVFSRDSMIECLDNDLTDFGKDIIPRAINQYKVQSYVFQGYWEDIGTIRSFFEANLALTEVVPPFDFFANRIFTNTRFLPGSKINEANVKNAIISDGCILSNCSVEDSVIGIRSVIESGSKLKRTVMMGSDYFRHLDPHDEEIPIGIGRDCVIEGALIDKNARIGDGVVITPEGKSTNVDSENYYIRDGVVVIPKNAVLPPGTWI